MSTLKTLKLTQRCTFILLSFIAAAIQQSLTSSVAPKQPVKKLPAEVELSPDATVEDVKVLIAKAVGLKDHHRIGLFDPETKRTLKDRQARIDDLPSVVAAGQVSVKDLGTSLPGSFSLLPLTNLSGRYANRMARRLPHRILRSPPDPRPLRRPPQTLHLRELPVRRVL